MSPVTLAVRLAVTLVVLAASLPASAEQLQRIGTYEAHYSLVPTTFLRPEVASRYGLSRGRDRALLNVSVLDTDGTPVRASLTGTVRNLLEQTEVLEFREVQEGTAIYYLHELRHSDREVLRFHLDITPPDGVSYPLEFQQKMYWEGR